MFKARVRHCCQKQWSLSLFDERVIRKFKKGVSFFAGGNWADSISIIRDDSPGPLQKQLYNKFPNRSNHLSLQSRSKTQDHRKMIGHISYFTILALCLPFANDARISRRREERIGKRWFIFSSRRSNSVDVSSEVGGTWEMFLFRRWEKAENGGLRIRQEPGWPGFMPARQFPANRFTSRQT